MPLHVPRQLPRQGARHGFTTNYPISGNVILRMRLRKGRYSSDTHRLLAHANLADSIELESAWLQSVNRGITSGGAGFTGKQNVFWNALVTENHPLTTCAVETAQWGFGYAIGTSRALHQDRHE